MWATWEILFGRSDFDREGRTLRSLLVFAYSVVPAMTRNSTPFPHPQPGASHQAKSTDPGQRAGAKCCSGVSDCSPGGAIAWDLPYGCLTPGPSWSQPTFQWEPCFESLWRPCLPSWTLKLIHPFAQQGELLVPSPWLLFLV